MQDIANNEHVMNTTEQFGKPYMYITLAGQAIMFSLTSMLYAFHWQLNVGFVVSV